MTRAEKINKTIITEVKTAINNVKNAQNGSFEVKEYDDGTDRISSPTFELTSKQWKKDSKIKISIDKISEFLGEPDDPWYWSKARAGVLLDRYGFIGFVGYISGLKDLKAFVPNKIKDFLENVFIPTSIKILEAYKTKKSSEVDSKKLKELYNNIFAGTMEKVPTEEEIADIFKKQASESKEEEKKEQTNESSQEEYDAYIKRFEEERQAAVDASHKFTLLLADKKFDEAEKFIHSNEFAKAISWFGDYRKQVEHFEDELYSAKDRAMGKDPDGIEWKKK